MKKLLLLVGLIPTPALAQNYQFYEYPDYNIRRGYEGVNPIQQGGYQNQIWWSAPPAYNRRPEMYAPQRFQRYPDYRGRSGPPRWNW